MADTSAIPFVLYPFAYSDQRKVASIDFLKSGITPDMTIPTKGGGAKFTRSHMNGIGYFATLGAYLDSIGYPYGKDRIDSQRADFSGYPKGAILITEDDDYVREYVSQKDNNTTALPTEAADGTYEGNEDWKPTLPTPVDFFPDFSTYVNKETKDISAAGELKYSVDEDGWYQIALYFSGLAWPTEPTVDNELFQAICQVTVSEFELCRLDGRFACVQKPRDYTRAFPVVSSTLPLKKGMTITFKYKLPEGRNLGARINFKRWGVSAL